MDGLKSNAWGVYLKESGKKRSKHIDTVFYSKGIKKDYVLGGLINHDNYDSRITVKRLSKKQRW
jgi:hypothetical protein